jgi:hypothetical protein
MKMDIKTLEYMSSRVKKGTDIHQKISDLLQTKKYISTGNKIRIYINGAGEYQDLLKYSRVIDAINDLIDLRINELGQEFDKL